MDFPWREDVDVTEFTERDLTANRSQQSAVSAVDDLPLLVESVRRGWKLPDVPFTIDFIIRVELARVIDNYEVSFSREDYDIAYMIPPVGYVEDNIDTVPAVDAETVHYDERSMHYFTTPTVFEMMNDAVEELDSVKDKTRFVLRGARNLVE